MKRKHFTIAVFVPELACPFQCVYCNQKKISGRTAVPQPADVKKTVESYLKTIPQKNTTIEIGFFGGNFTGIDIIEQQKYLEIARDYLNAGDISGIRLSTRPDYINTKILLMLKNYGVTSIELGAQSTDEEILIKSARGHTREDIKDASSLILQSGFKLGLQMMIGLPGDTLEKSIKTARDIIEWGASETRIYPCLVIKNTRLAEWYQNDSYKPLSLETAVKWSKEIFLLFENSDVNVIRMGLHPSEGLLSGHDLLAGPFHPSFRELVLSEIWKDRFRKIPANVTSDQISIYVPPSQLNYAAGYNSTNKNDLIRQFKKVRFLIDASLSKREYRVVTDSKEYFFKCSS